MKRMIQLAAAAILGLVMVQSSASAAPVGLAMAGADKPASSALIQVRGKGGFRHALPFRHFKHKHHWHRRHHWYWGGLAIVASDYRGCGYEYYKWKSTGSRYWHRRYRECRYY